MIAFTLSLQPKRRSIERLEVHCQCAQVHCQFEGGIRAKEVVSLDSCELELHGVQKLVLLQPTEVTNIIDSPQQPELLQELVIVDVSKLMPDDATWNAAKHDCDLRKTALVSLTVPSWSADVWPPLVPPGCQVIGKHMDELKAQYPKWDPMHKGEMVKE